MPLTKITGGEFDNTQGGLIVAGIITATKFVGDGSLLTNVPGSSNSGYANTAGIATYATNAGIATYSTSSGIATYATNAGIATYATNAGIATYATNAGYATTSGISTVAQNLTGSPNITVSSVNSSGVVTASSFSGSGANLTGISGIPSGTLMLFQQTAAPTGWTKQTTHNDKALRVVTGAASSGGSTAFTSIFASRTPTGSVDNTTLTTAQIPTHNHSLSRLLPTSPSVISPYDGWAAGNRYTNATTGTSGDAGGGGAHNHGFTGTAMDFAVQYVDLIIASKD